MSGSNILAIAILAAGAGASLGAANIYVAGGFDDTTMNLNGHCQRVLSVSSWDRRSRSDAETRALIRWTMLAKKRGPEYGSWVHAADRQITCRKISDGTTRCAVQARPCRNQPMPQENRERPITDL